MRQFMDDKRIRYLLIAVLIVVLALGALNIISTAFSLLVPLAVIAVGGFAFYKIVLEGRGETEGMRLTKPLKHQACRSSTKRSSSEWTKLRVSMRTTKMNRRRANASARSSGRRANSSTPPPRPKKSSIKSRRASGA